MATQGMRQRLFFVEEGQNISGVVLLLIGTPGTGKRPVGQYLAQERGFVHLDSGKRGDPRCAARPERDRSCGPSSLVCRRVATAWSSPGAPGASSNWMTSTGCARPAPSPLWFDSDRGAACSAHFVDAREPPCFHFVDRSPRGQVPPGQRRCLRAPAPGPPRLRPGGPARRDVRARYGDGLAFLAGAAAATTALLVVARAPRRRASAGGRERATDQLRIM